MSGDGFAASCPGSTGRLTWAAWAPGDLGVRKAIAAFYGDVDPRTVVERFDPFQNLTVHYLLTGARVLG